MDEHSGSNINMVGTRHPEDYKDVLRVEDVDSESQPVDSVERLKPAHTTIMDNNHQGTSDLSDMPNVVQTTGDETDADTDFPLTERSDVLSVVTTGNTATHSPTKASTNCSNRSQTVVSLNKTDSESVSNLDKSYKSSSTFNNVDTKPEISRKLTPFERLKATVPKLTVERESLKSKETLTLQDITSETNNGKEQTTRCESSLSRVPTRMSQRSIDAKIAYTNLNMPVDDKREMVSPEDSWIRLAIPYLPLWLAILCLFLNMVIPGLGTMISGFCIFCCATSRVPAKYDQEPILLLCVNIWVGLAQLFTVTFLLVGWFWSLAWGIRMVILSLERRREMKAQRAREIQEMAVKAFSNKLGW